MATRRAIVAPVARILAARLGWWTLCCASRVSRSNSEGWRPVFRTREVARGRAMGYAEEALGRSMKRNG